MFKVGDKVKRVHLCDSAWWVSFCKEIKKDKDAVFTVSAVTKNIDDKVNGLFLDEQVGSSNAQYFKKVEEKVIEIKVGSTVIVSMNSPSLQRGKVGVVTKVWHNSWRALGVSHYTVKFDVGGKFQSVRMVKKNVLPHTDKTNFRDQETITKEVDDNFYVMSSMKNGTHNPESKGTTYEEALKRARDLSFTQLKEFMVVKIVAKTKTPRSVVDVELIK